MVVLRLGGVVIDEGEWLDLGDREAYLQAHCELEVGSRIHPDAQVEEGAKVFQSVIGSGVLVKSGAVVRDSVIWPNAEVKSDADLDHCIIYSGKPVTGLQKCVDL